MKSSVSVVSNYLLVCPFPAISVTHDLPSIMSCDIISANDFFKHLLALSHAVSISDNDSSSFDEICDCAHFIFFKIFGDGYSILSMEFTVMKD